MGAPAAVLIAINYSDIKSLMKQQCPKCGNVMATIRSRIVAAKRYRRFECRSCGHRISLGGDNADQQIDRYSRDPRPTRRFDAATIQTICESKDINRVVAKQHGCSETMIQDIRNGKFYRDLLPEGFRAPPGAGDPSCEQCQFYAEAKPEQIEVEAQKKSCSLGIPEFETEGVRAIRDCSAFADRQQPANGAA
jgi:transcription elongation factor Elf1